MTRTQQIGTFTQYTHCRGCGGTNVATVIDLGLQPLAGGFIPHENAEQRFAEEKFFPLELAFCSDCYLLQTTAVVDKHALFDNYFYATHTIGTLVTHFESLAKKIAQHFEPDKTRILEIGSNDGTFLRALTQAGFQHCMGVDPAQNLVKHAIDSGLNCISDFFTEKIAEQIRDSFGQVDLVTSFNMFAHVEDLHEIIRGIQKVLKPTGSYLFEVHYLGSILSQLQYDMIYHEHQYYYSVHALVALFKPYGFSIKDVEFVDTHAGSIRVTVDQTKTAASERVAQLLQEEATLGYTHVAVFSQYNSAIQNHKKELKTLLLDLKKKGKKIAGYGASGRGTILSNFCELDAKLLTSVIDDSPLKQGAYMPGTHLPIVASTVLYDTHAPDCCLLFAWSFADEITRKHKRYLENGGQFITPLPKPKILEL